MVTWVARYTVAKHVLVICTWLETHIFFIMYHVEGQKAPLILNMYENDYMWAKNKFGYNIKFCTDCFNEIIFLDKWACTKKLAQPKTFFSSKSWRSFSKERLHTTVTCHCAILRNIEILVYYRGTSFALLISNNLHKCFKYDTQ